MAKQIMRYILSDKDIVKEKYLKDQKRRIDYLTSHIEIIGQWYDLTIVGNKTHSKIIIGIKI